MPGDKLDNVDISSAMNTDESKKRKKNDVTIYSPPQDPSLQDPPQDSVNRRSREMFEIVEWYKLNVESFIPQDLELIIAKRGKLAAYAVDYAKVILRYAKDYGKYHVDRSVNVKILSNQLQSQQDPDAAQGKTYTNARANEKATIENKELYRLEYEAEANYNGHRLILNQINHVLDAMKQDIAELRSIRGDNDKTTADTGR